MSVLAKKMSVLAKKKWKKSISGPSEIRLLHQELIMHNWGGGGSVVTQVISGKV